MAKLKILWYDNFGENQTLLHRNGIAAIPKSEGFDRIPIKIICDARGVLLTPMAK